jgi:hypothetical protein
MELVALLGYETFNQIRSFGQINCTSFQHHECRHALLLEHGVSRVLVKTVNQFDEPLLNKLEMFRDCRAESIETLHYEVLFLVLGSEGKNVYDDRPPRFDELGFRTTNISYTHNDVIFYVISCVQIVQHDGFEGLQKFFLEVETLESLH